MVCIVPYLAGERAPLKVMYTHATVLILTSESFLALLLCSFIIGSINYWGRNHCCSGSQDDPHKGLGVHILYETLS